jgi:reactive intermediate/imine deaminase
MKQKIYSDNAPAAIGPYSQAIRFGHLTFLSGQIALDPLTMELVANDIDAQVRQVFANMVEVVKASGMHMRDIVKMTIYLTDLAHFSVVNAAMVAIFTEPYPARTTIEVSALPKNALIEIDAILMAAD